jgi:Zn-dependent protease
MDSHQITDGLISYLLLVALLTFHEFGHAWTAWKCGDDTAHLQGRVSLNPLVHIDLFGTVLLPLFMIFGPSSVTRFVLGYAKPVPFNPANLRNRWRDEMLIAMAGPAMNLILAVVLVSLARVVVMFHSDAAADLFIRAAQLSLLLCFFNLIPIPPLDGSHVMRNLSGMSYETYWRLCQHTYINFAIIIIVINLPFVRAAFSVAVNGTLLLIGKIFGF